MTCNVGIFTPHFVSALSTDNGDWVALATVGCQRAAVDDCDSYKKDKEHRGKRSDKDGDEMSWKGLEKRWTELRPLITSGNYLRLSLISFDA